MNLKDRADTGFYTGYRISGRYHYLAVAGGCHNQIYSV